MFCLQHIDNGEFELMRTGHFYVLKIQFKLNIILIKNVPQLAFRISVRVFPVPATSTLQYFCLCSSMPIFEIQILQFRSYAML